MKDRISHSKSEDYNPLPTPANDNMPDGWVTESQFANWIGKSIRTVQRMRAARRSPPWVKVGNSILYRVEAIKQWLLANETSVERRRR